MDEGHLSSSNTIVITLSFQHVIEFSICLDEQAPQRQCCEIMDRGSDDNMWIRIRKCSKGETITT